MDLRTTYLGLELPHPLMPGASPLVDDLDAVRRLEDAGAAAIVMHSLFEEQLTGEELATLSALEDPAESFAEARTYLPTPPGFALGPDDYLEQLARIKAAVSCPVIGSLNGVTPSGWLDYAQLIEQAGADALELNTYHLATDPGEEAATVEQRTLDVLRAVEARVSIPVAVKLSPYYSSLSAFAARLEQAGAAGLVLFNRFYQPDLDMEQLEVLRQLRLSDPSELALRLRWLAVLSAQRSCSLAASGGVHSGLDAVKALASGAHAVQLVSALLQRGPEHLATVRAELERWLEEHEYESLRQLQGSMNLARCPDPRAYERANYVRMLQSWEGLR
ncbi:MAG: dihydroorotate dehydrogenase-like protein [Planctomycetota bacterium]